jgi:flagellar hook-length control protein FliK
MIGSLPHSPQPLKMPGSGQSNSKLENLSQESLGDLSKKSTEGNDPQEAFIKLLQGLQAQTNMDSIEGQGQEIVNEISNPLRGKVPGDLGLVAKNEMIMASVNDQTQFQAPAQVGDQVEAHNLKLAKLLNPLKGDTAKSNVQVNNLDKSSLGQLKELLNTSFDQVQVDAKVKGNKQVIEIPEIKVHKMSTMTSPQKMAFDQYQMQNPDASIIKLPKTKTEQIEVEGFKQNSFQDLSSDVAKKKINMSNKEPKGISLNKVSAQVSNEQMTAKTVDEITKQFELPIKKGEREFSIQIKDHQIGEMKIKATQAKDGIHLRVESNSVEVKDFLNGHKTRIIENLASSGIRVSDVKIDQGSFASQDKDFSQSQNENARQQFSRERHDEGKERRRELWEMFQEQSRAA